MRSAPPRPRDEHPHLVAATCDACGGDLPGWARWCGACGEPIDVDLIVLDDAPAPMVTSERPAIAWSPAPNATSVARGTHLADRPARRRPLGARLPAAALLVAALVVGVAVAGDRDQPTSERLAAMPRGDARADGVVGDHTLAAAPTVAWVLSLDDGLAVDVAPLATDHDRGWTVVRQPSGTTSVLSLADGALLGQAWLPGTAVVSDDLLLTRGPDGDRLVAHRLPGLAPAWDRLAPEHPRQGPLTVLTDDPLSVSTLSAAIGLSREDGRTRWVLERGDRGQQPSFPFAVPSDGSLEPLVAVPARGAWGRPVSRVVAAADARHLGVVDGPLLPGDLAVIDGVLHARVPVVDADDAEAGVVERFGIDVHGRLDLLGTSSTLVPDDEPLLAVLGEAPPPTPDEPDAIRGSRGLEVTWADGGWARTLPTERGLQVVTDGDVAIAATAVGAVAVRPDGVRAWTWEPRLRAGVASSLVVGDLAATQLVVLPGDVADDGSRTGDRVVVAPPPRVGGATLDASTGVAVAPALRSSVAPDTVVAVPGLAAYVVGERLAVAVGDEATRRGLGATGGPGAGLALLPGGDAATGTEAGVRAIVAAGPGGARALVPTAERAAWSREDLVACAGPTVLAGDDRLAVVLVPTVDGGVHALSVATGATAWRLAPPVTAVEAPAGHVPARARAAACPTVVADGDDVHVVVGDVLRRVARSTGRVGAVTALPAVPTSAPVRTGRTLLVTGDDEQLHGVDLDAGATWSTPLPSPAVGPPVVLRDGTVVVPTVDGLAAFR